jgi:hypothetical protein
MLIVIFGLVCFWSGAAGLIAYLVGWPVLPPVLVVGGLTSAILLVVTSLCHMSAYSYPEERPIHIQAYFGGTFEIKKAKREVS